jgi:hypothetical protein
MPVPYSDETTSTPSVIRQICPRIRPKKAGIVYGTSVKSSLVVWAATRKPMPTTSSTKTPSVHIVERTDLIFVHSEASA